MFLMMPISKKFKQIFFKANAALIMLIVSVCQIDLVLAQEIPPAETASDLETGAKPAPCKDLKPFNNIDELL